MPEMNIQSTSSKGFTLVELLVAAMISTIAAMAVLPQLEQRFKQSAVDTYTGKLEAGINQIKANMVSRQSSCQIDFPNGAGSENEIKPQDIEDLAIDNPLNPNCPKPTNMQGNGSMATTDLRFVNIKHTLSPQQANDVRLLISPATISMNTVGGVTAPEASFDPRPLTIRIRSSSLHAKGKGQERCLKLEVMTGTLIRGSWQGNTFSDGKCTQNQ